MSAKLIKQSKGHKLAVLIEGDPGELQQTSDSLFNWNAADRFYHTDNPKQLFFWTDKVRLLHYFENLLEHRFYMKYGHEPNFPGAKELIHSSAVKHLNGIPTDGYIIRLNHYLIH